MMNLSVPSFTQCKVLVIGDILLDRYWEGGATRISPEAVVNVDKITDRPGGAGNVALNLASLGCDVALAGFTGADAEARILRAALLAAGVNCALTELPDHSTIVKLRVIAQRQQLLRLDFEQPGHYLQEGVPAHWQALLDDCDVLLLSDYAKGTLAQPQALIAMAKSRQVPVFVDPKGEDFSLFQGADLLTPNRREFEAVVGVCDSESQLIERGQKLIKKLALGALLITRGEQGMTLLFPTVQEAHHFPAQAREVFDVTGAGDTVIATIAAAVAGGELLPQAVALANIAAGLGVGKLGAAVVTAPELSAAIQVRASLVQSADQAPVEGSVVGVDASKNALAERGVISTQSLERALEHARSRHESIVFTNGCFDILHAGHVAYLAQARALGQRLIVAVNDDDSVARLKGEGRPINPLAHRMAVLAALECVDWVVSFSQDTPTKLLDILRPDILVKGGDYQAKEQIVGWELVESYGGTVRLLDGLDAVSTSKIVRDIQNNSKC